MFLVTRLTEAIACQAAMLAWRLDPWLAQVGWPWFETPAKTTHRPRHADADRAAGAEPFVASPAAGRPVHAANDSPPTSAVRRPSSSFSRWAAKVVPIIVACAVALPCANHLAWSAVYPPAYWQQATSNMLRPPVYDAAGLLAGYLPGDQGMVPGAVYAVQPDAITDACVDLVLLREDRHAGTTFRHVLAVDWPRLIYGTVTGNGGGSTLPMQMARQVSGWQTSMTTASRKLREIGVAQTLLDVYGGDYRALARAYLSTARFAIYQGDMRGIAAAAEVMWGLRASQLSPAQCAVLVTMLPVKVSLKDEGAHVQQQWAVRKHQAEALLRQAYGPHAEPMVADVHASGALPPRRALIEALGPSATYNLDSRTRTLVEPHFDRLAADGRWTAVELASRTQPKEQP